MSVTTNKSITRTSANIATILFVIVIILQLLLAAGILPVTMAWGGQQSVYDYDNEKASHPKSC